MPSMIETYRLQELPGETFSVAYSEKKKKNNDISTDETSNKKSLTKKFEPFIGILCTLFHALFIQIISVIVKKVWYISVCQHSLVRYTGIFVFSLPLTVLCTNQILGEKKYRGLLLLRGIIAAAATIFQITAYRYLQLVQASTVMSTLPLVTALTARILLKEPFGIVQTICLIITICAVLLSIRLPQIALNNKAFHFDVYQLIGYAAAIGFILCMALSTVGMRKLKKTHFSIIMLYTGFAGIVETATAIAIMFPFATADCGLDHSLYITLPFVSYASLLMMTVAVQHEPAGLFAVQKSCFEILVITVFQIVFFRKYPDWYATVGACLVLISLCIIGFKIWIEMMPEESAKRKRFKWILS